MSVACALSSCTQTKCADCLDIQSKKPFLAAERTPFRLAEIIFSMVRGEKNRRAKHNRFGQNLWWRYPPVLRRPAGYPITMAACCGTPASLVNHTNLEG